MGVKITTNMGLCLHLALKHMGRSPMFTNCEVSHVLMSLTTTMSTKKPMYLPSTHMHNLHNLFSKHYCIFLAIGYGNTFAFNEKKKKKKINGQCN